jgi:NAD-dependent DNA ligase
MDIEGLGGETVALLFNNGLVHNYADLYELTVNQILPLSEWLKNQLKICKRSSKQYTYLSKVYCLH